MSLSIDGVWKAGVWATTVWADGVWFEGTATPVLPPDQGKGSGGSRKKRSGLYDDVDLPKIGFFEQAKTESPVTAETSIDKKALDSNLENPIPLEKPSPSYTAMAEAFERAGIVEKFIVKQEMIDKRMKLNLAAIILLLD